MKKYIILIYLAGISFGINGQSLYDSAKNELLKINAVFDSSSYLSFNLQIDYRGSINAVRTTMADLPIVDSLGNQIEIGSETISGSYTLNNKNMYYEMGNTIFAQTDSFMYNIYKDEETIVMTKNILPSINQQFPFREFLDSLLIEGDYTITIDTVAIDTTQDLGYSRIITYVGRTSARLKELIVYYDHATYYPYLFQYSYLDSGVSPITGIAEIDTLLSNTGTLDDMTLLLDRTISMKFSKYETSYTPRIFRDEEYVIYNRQRKIFETSEKYKNYRFFTSGFDNADPDEEIYAEIPYVEN